MGRAPKKKTSARPTRRLNGRFVSEATYQKHIRAQKQPRLNGRFVSQATWNRHQRAKAQPRINGRFAPKPVKPKPLRDLQGRFGKVTRRETPKGAWVDYEFKISPPVPIAGLPAIARGLAERNFGPDYYNRATLILAHLAVEEDDGTIGDYEWKTLAATAKLEASLNNLEAEIDAFESNINYKQAYITDSTAFRFWMGV